MSLRSSLLFFLCALSIGACGARTTLVVDEPRDAGIDAPPSIERDGGPDRGRDAGPLLRDAPSCTAPLPAWFEGSVELELLFAFGGARTPLGDRAELTLALIPTTDGTDRDVLGVAHSLSLQHRDAAALVRETTRLGCRDAGCVLRLESPALRCEDVQLEILDLMLEGIDADCDGVAERVSGAANVRALANDDAGMSRRWVEGRAALEASPDTVAPSLRIESTDLPNAPFRGVRVVPSEPLRPEIALDLLGMATAPLRIEADPRGFWIGGARSFATALPAMQPVYVSADGPIEDFAGNTATAEARVRSWSGLGAPFPIDGFESGEGVAVQGGASRMSRVGSIDPLSGAFGMWMPPGSLPEDAAERWVLVRLPRAGRTLAFEARFLGRGTRIDPSATYEVQVFDDAGLRATSPITPSRAPRATRDAVFTEATDTETFRVALPPDVSGAPIVVFHARTVTCGQPAPATFGLWLDDLRVE